MEVALNMLVSGLDSLFSVINNPKRDRFFHQTPRGESTDKLFESA